MRFFRLGVFNNCQGGLGEESSEDGQPLDIHMQYRSNNAELYSEIEDFQRSISLEKNKWDEAKPVKLMSDIMRHLQNGGRYRLVGD